MAWKFVSDGWDWGSHITIHLPVPSGQSIVAGDTVRAWGHGPLDANVEITNNAVVYRSLAWELMVWKLVLRSQPVGFWANSHSTRIN